MDKDHKIRRYSIFELKKELVEKSTSEILADFLLVSDTGELYDLLRWTIMALRSKLANASDFENKNDDSEVRAFNVLYSLVRFVQQYKRFPSRKEQADIISEDHRGISAFSELLREEERSPKGRAARRRQEAAKNKNTVGIDIE